MASDVVCACNFSFAFDDPKFSDRVLSIEIMPDPLETQPNGTAVLPTQNRKRSRDGVVFNNQENGDSTSMHCDDVNSSIPVVGGSMASKNQNKDSDATIEESSSGAEATRRHDASRSKDFSSVFRVKTIHINSAVLAVKSPFFYKLFSNGLGESEQRVATLRIHASEEAALMELLNFMYNNTLPTTSLSCLLDILMAADKFDVASCMRYCSQRLSKIPMTCDLALSYLDLPSSVLQAVPLQQLTDSAKQFIAVQFRDVKKFENQVLNLSLAGLEAILSSDDIQVRSEDVVYDLVLKWAEVHYPQLDKRRGVLETRLRHLIRFPYMTILNLKKFTTSTNFSPEVASEIVLEALFFKAETPYRQRQLAQGRHVTGQNIVNTDQRFVERAYMYLPVKAVELEIPHHHCVAYLDLKREECVRLFPAEWNCSKPFHLGKQGFFLSACCNRKLGIQCFGLYLTMLEKGSASFAVDFEFAAWSKEEENYKTKYKKSHTFIGRKSIGSSNLFDKTWAPFIAEDSPYFINGILHLRAVVSIK